jgi:hypothetical protein
MCGKFAIRHVAAQLLREINVPLKLALLFASQARPRGHR